VRILREAGLTLPINDSREARDLAGTRRAAFLDPPTRRNQVWQMGFLELETAGGGTWRSGDVVDYWAKVVLAGPVTKTQTHRDAIASVLAAIDEAERLLGRPLIEDLTDPDGTVHPIYLVTDG
jgi:putative transposase